MSRRLRPPAALAMLALIVAGCSGTSSGTGGGAHTVATTPHEKSVKFAECMRDNGVGAFPDPDASGTLTIDGVLNGSSLDSDSAAWKTAMRVCKDLQPPGFTGTKVTPERRKARLAFARCIRDHGVKDFPDPADDQPLVDTNHIPSAATEAGMTILNAAMHTCGALAEAALAKGAR